MSSKEDSDVPSASDLITYIGVPLTIISLLPLAYNAIVTLIHLHTVKRKLKLSNVKARIHSDIFNRLVEVELPKYIIRSPQPSPNIRPAGDFSTQYEFSAAPSKLPGGSWTLLEWELLRQGTKTQRTQPGDDPRQPQARVLFWDLISRFYELGGLPDESGWHQLHSTPLWAEDRRLMILQNLGTNCSLELKVASPRDSDGPISLKLVRKGSILDWNPERGGQGRARPGTIALPHGKPAGEQTPGPTAIFCRIASEGLETAFTDPATGDTLDIEHLQIRSGEGRQGIWFASCAAALNVESQTPILEYRVPADIRQLLAANIIPDGVVKLVYGVETVEVPTWVTVQHLAARRHNSEAGDGLESQQQTEPMDDDTRIRKHLREKSRSKINESIDRIEQALGTPAAELSQLEAASLDWLKAHADFSDDTSAGPATRDILARMVTDKVFSRSLCQMLEHWRTWATRGAMSVEDFCLVNQGKDMFAQASLVITTLSGLENGSAGALISMQECAAKWEYVELG